MFWKDFWSKFLEKYIICVIIRERIILEQNMADKKEKRYIIDNPKLMAEWNYERNDDFKPEHFTANSGKKVWWKCQKGHEWQATVAHRNNGRGCPYCAGKKVLKGYNDFQTENPSLVKEWNYERNGELKPEHFTANSNKKAWWKCGKGHEWQATVNNRNKGNGCPYCAGQKVLKGYNDLQTVNPTLAQEWNYEENDGLTPMDVMPNSDKRVWWKCNKGHEWQATIASRNNDCGCPYCAGKKVLKGYNDLQTVNPTLAQEWNYEKNNVLTPMDVMPNSHNKVWWKCGKGHEWQATIGSRNKGNGCPYCADKKVLKGYNDLQTVNPTLSKEWNYEKNGKLKPEQFTANSGKKAWWKCQKGHEWQARIGHRNNGSGCPVCKSELRTSFPEYALVFYLKKYGLEVIHSYKGKGYELDVYIPSKNIAIEYDGYYWHKDKITQDLDKNFKCKQDEITLYRIREGLPLLNDSSLDYIAKTNQKDLPLIFQKILSEIIGISIDINFERDAIAIESLREFIEKGNSLLSSNPKMANEWNYERNGNLKPEQFTANSGKKVWWKCQKGHEWQARIAGRNNGNGCPYCSGRYAVKGYNDLQTVNPTLSKEWNHEKNGKLKPEQFTANSGKKAWWKCNKGHEWQATIASRNNGCGCPYCAGQKVVKNENDLQTVNPTLAQEWNYEKNDGLTPMDVMPNSNKTVWWKCNKGHEWQATVAHRNNGRGCPYCAGQKVLKGYNDLQTVNPTLAQEWNYEKNGKLKPEYFMPNSNKKVWWKCGKGHEWQATMASRNNGSGCPHCAKEKRKFVK